MAVIKYLLYSGTAVCDIVKAAIIRIITHLPFTILYSNSIAVYVYLYIPSSTMFQFFLFFSLLLLYVAVIALECSWQSVINSGCCRIQIQLTSHQSGMGFSAIRKHAIMDILGQRLPIFLFKNFILMRNENGILSTIFMSFPPTPPSYPHPLPRPFLSFSPCKFDSGPRTGSSPPG